MNYSNEFANPKSFSGFTNLKDITIEGKILDDNFFSYIIQCKKLVTLILHNSDNEFTDKGILELSLLPKLKELSVSSTNITDNALSIILRD